MYGDLEEAQDAFQELWDMFKLAHQKGHPAVFAVMDSMWLLLRSLGSSFHFIEGYSAQYQLYKLNHNIQSPAFGIKQKVEDTLCQIPLNRPALLELLILRLLDHACYGVQIKIVKHIFTILSFEKELNSLLVLHIIDNYARINKIKKLRNVVKPYIKLEADKAFILVDPTRVSQRFLTFITWVDQLIEGGGYAVSNPNVATTFFLHLVSVGLQLDIQAAKMQVYRKKMSVQNDERVKKFFDALLALAPENMHSDINALISLKLEQALEEYLRSILQEMHLLAKNRQGTEDMRSFTLQMQGACSFYKERMVRLLGIYVPILKVFNQVESMLIDYQGLETPEERYEILNGYARDLFINYFMAIAYQYATTATLAQEGRGYASNAEGIIDLLERLLLIDTRENTKAMSALMWFNKNVVGLINEWDFLSIGRKEKTGFSFIQQLQRLVKRKGVPELFKLYANLLMAQYFFYVMNNKKVATQFLESVENILTSKDEEASKRLSALIEASIALHKAIPL